MISACSNLHLIDLLPLARVYQDAPGLPYGILQVGFFLLCSISLEQLYAKPAKSSIS